MPSASVGILLGRIWAVYLAYGDHRRLLTFFPSDFLDDDDRGTRGPPYSGIAVGLVPFSFRQI